MTEGLPVSFDQAALSGNNASELTPARLFVGRAGTAYTTATQLRLRADHAFAKDAIRESLSLDVAPMKEVADSFGMFEVATEIQSHDDYLARPDLGRRLSPEAIETVKTKCLLEADVQVVIGDGLSPLAVQAQVPLLLGPLLNAVADRDWTSGPPFLVRHCRVGVMNDIGDATGAKNVVLLIGERPGLATAESLSAYLAHLPRSGDTDARRNLVSNIHSAGVSPEEAVQRIVGLVDSFMLQGRSGFTVKEAGQTTSLPRSADR